MPRSIYFGTTEGDLYAVNAQTGSLRWCINIITTNNSQVFVGTPAAVDGVVYVCVSPSLDDHTGSLYALNASDGAMRWRSKTDCVINSIGFGDSGLPLVSNGVVYSGFYAVREQDGVPLWKVSSALGLEIVFLAVSNRRVYGSTPWYVFALNASNGSMHWRYPPYKFGIGSAQLVSDQLLMVGTQEPVDQQTSALYALNAETGTLRWYFLMGSYTGAAFLNNVVYVGAGDG